MNKRDNPYTPGAGRKPRVLAGRDPDLENVQALIERQSGGDYERSLIYSGLRGVGKTVLLLEFDVLASEAGWATTDVQEVGSQPDFRVTFARMAARLLREMSRKHRIKDRVDRALSVVKAFSIAVPGAVQLKLDVEAASGIADSGDPEQDLAELIVEIGEVAQQTQSGALFLIDEMQNLDSTALAAICIAFQAISRRGLPVALVGAGLPDLQVRLISAKPYADRLFQYHELGRLSDAAARAALIGLAAALGVEFEGAGRPPGRARIGRLPLLPPGVRARALEHRRAIPDPQGRHRHRARDRQRGARAQLLRSPLPARHRHRAALPRRHGPTSAIRLPLQRGRRPLRGQRPARRLRPPRLAHPEGTDLEPAPRPARLHRAALRRVPPRHPPARLLRRRPGGCLSTATNSVAATM